MSLAVGSLTKEKITLYHCALRAMRGLTSADDQSERSSRVLFCICMPSRKFLCDASLRYFHLFGHERTRVDSRAHKWIVIANA
jgi:hypothetical protein